MEMSVLEQAVPTGTWKADPVHSSVRIEVQHMGVSTFGAGFTDFDARLGSGPGGVELEGSARVESFDVQDDQLRGHVLSPEFLDAERHPELRFRSTGFRQDGDEVIAEGELTIKGNTRPVEAGGRVGQPVEDPQGNQRTSVVLETEIDRTEFGLGWQMDLPGGGVALANDVKLLVSLELVKEA
jgi:polyisoprenoid-binding protein YceI